MHAPLETFRIVDGSDVYCKTSTSQYFYMNATVSILTKLKGIHGGEGGGRGEWGAGSSFLGCGI